MKNHDEYTKNERQRAMDIKKKQATKALSKKSKIKQVESVIAEMDENDEDLKFKAIKRNAKQDGVSGTANELFNWIEAALRNYHKSQK